MPEGPGIEAIPTRYKGTLYRSQLEAQWALVMHDLQEPYEYEPQLFKVDTRLWYVPDFWLPRREMWLEIKPPQGVTEVARQKATGLFRVTKRPLYLFCGFPQVAEFTDLLGSDSHSEQVCGFEMWAVDSVSPDILRRLHVSSLHIALLHFFGLIDRSMSPYEFRANSDRLVKAVRMGIDSTSHGYMRIGGPKSIHEILDDMMGVEQPSDEALK